jgi:small subunit ribosomal protein S17
MTEETAVEKPAQEAAPVSRARGLRKTREGTVVSKSGDKTIVVETETRVPHPRFRKIIRRSRKFHAHDEENKAKTGDRVRIAETRPISKRKRWRLVEVLGS